MKKLFSVLFFSGLLLAFGCESKKSGGEEENSNPEATMNEGAEPVMESTVDTETEVVEEAELTEEAEASMEGETEEETATE